MTLTRRGLCLIVELSPIPSQWSLYLHDRTISRGAQTIYNGSHHILVEQNCVNGQTHVDICQPPSIYYNAPALMTRKDAARGGRRFAANKTPSYIIQASLRGARQSSSSGSCQPQSRLGQGHYNLGDLVRGFGLEG